MVFRADIIRTVIPPFRSGLAECCRERSAGEGGPVVYSLMINDAPSDTDREGSAKQPTTSA